MIFLLASVAWAPQTDGVDSVTMSHRLTKEELDEQFELFLKEVTKHFVQTDRILFRIDYMCMDSRVLN